MNPRLLNAKQWLEGKGAGALYMELVYFKRMGSACRYQLTIRNMHF